MTPAERAGLEVGDEIRVIKYTTGSLAQKGDLLKLVWDDGTRNPEFYNKRTTDSLYFTLTCENEWEKVVEPKSKKMKFWIGEDEDKELVRHLTAILSSLGYDVGYATTCARILFIDDEGDVDSYTYPHTKLREQFEDMDGVEINIDWMRTPKPERPTVSVGENVYYEDELAEALSKIKPVG